MASIDQSIDKILEAPTSVLPAFIAGGAFVLGAYQLRRGMRNAGQQLGQYIELAWAAPQAVARALPGSSSSAEVAKVARPRRVK